MNSPVKISPIIHSGPENLSQPRPKKLVKSNKSISRIFFEQILFVFAILNLVYDANPTGSLVRGSNDPNSNISYSSKIFDVTLHFRMMNVVMKIAMNLFFKIIDLKNVSFSFQVSYLFDNFKCSYDCGDFVGTSFQISSYKAMLF